MAVAGFGIEFDVFKVSGTKKINILRKSILTCLNTGLFDEIEQEY